MYIRIYIWIQPPIWPFVCSYLLGSLPLKFKLQNEIYFAANRFDEESFARPLCIDIQQRNADSSIGHRTNEEGATKSQTNQTEHSYQWKCSNKKQLKLKLFPKSGEMQHARLSTFTKCCAALILNRPSSIAHELNMHHTNNDLKMLWNTEKDSWLHPSRLNSNPSIRNTAQSESLRCTDCFWNGEAWWTIAPWIEFHV